METKDKYLTVVFDIAKRISILVVLWGCIWGMAKLFADSVSDYVGLIFSIDYQLELV